MSDRTRTERWWTCTPRDFTGGESFFSRDTGLLCLGFRQLGMDSKAVLLGGPREDDKPWVVRATIQQLRSARWWASQKIEGVVLYAWARPEYTPVAEAIREAGVRLILSQDSGGLVSPVCGVPEWIQDRWRWASRSGLWGPLVFILQIVRGLTWGLATQDLRRLDHLSVADRVAAVSPVALARYQRFFRWFGREDLVGRWGWLPHAVSSGGRCRQGVPRKKKIILSVGRWEDEAQKQPDLLVEVIEKVLESDEDARFIIFGRPTSTMIRWSDALDAQMRDRVEFRGAVDHQSIVAAMEEAKILLVPSSCESFHIAAGEALCCGMSVVAARSPSLPSFSWFVSDGDGTLAPKLCGRALAGALRAEIAAWEEDAREPDAIALRWGQRLHESSVAARVVAGFGNDPPSA